MIQAVLFDMDGLMVDTEPLYWQVAREMGARRGKAVSDETLRHMMGRSRHESMEVYRRELGLSESVEALLEEREAAMLALYALGVSPMPGLLELLGELSGKLRLAVCTSSPRKFVEVLLPGMGVREGVFEVVQTGDGIVRGKPDPEIYLACMKKLGVDGPACVVLEDTQAGCRAGHSAGGRVIAVPTHLTESQDFSFCAARVRNLTEAGKVIRDWS